jgi:hypothetical protein
LLPTLRIVCIGDTHAAVCGGVLNGELPIEGGSVRGWLVKVPATDTDDATVEPTWAWVTATG